MIYLLIKTLHILGAILFLGTGLGSAYYKWRADRSGNLEVIAWCQREIVFADWIFTVPAGIIMPVTGISMMHLYGFPWTSPWIIIGFAGYAIAGICWLPAAFLQIKMRTLADEALEKGRELPPEFHKANRIWMILGFPAFLASIGVLWVMVSKGSYWSA